MGVALDRVDAAVAEAVASGRFARRAGFSGEVVVKRLVEAEVVGPRVCGVCGVAVGVGEGWRPDVVLGVVHSSLDSCRRARRRAGLPELVEAEVVVAGGGAVGVSRQDEEAAGVSVVARRDAVVARLGLGAATVEVLRGDLGVGAVQLRGDLGALERAGRVERSGRRVGRSVEWRVAVDGDVGVGGLSGRVLAEVRARGEASAAEVARVVGSTRRGVFKVLVAHEQVREGRLRVERCGERAVARGRSEVLWRVAASPRGKVDLVKRAAREAAVDLDLDLVGEGVPPDVASEIVDRGAGIERAAADAAVDEQAAAEVADRFARAAEVVGPAVRDAIAAASSPVCRHCGADCTDGRSWDGGDLYACSKCAALRAFANRTGRRDWMETAEGRRHLAAELAAPAELPGPVIGTPLPPETLAALEGAPAVAEKVPEPPLELSAAAGEYVQVLYRVAEQLAGQGLHPEHIYDRIERAIGIGAGA